MHCWAEAYTGTYDCGATYTLIKDVYIHNVSSEDGGFLFGNEKYGNTVPKVYLLDNISITESSCTDTAFITFKPEITIFSLNLRTSNFDSNIGDGTGIVFSTNHKAPDMFSVTILVENSHSPT